MPRNVILWIVQYSELTKFELSMFSCTPELLHYAFISWLQRICRSFATRVSQLKIWHFWVTSMERDICRCTFNRYNVITQFAKLAIGEQLCRRCTHRKLQHFKTFKSLSWKITHFELWHCCRKWVTYINNFIHNIFIITVKNYTFSQCV
jgi:hypothetical protein